MRSCPGRALTVAILVSVSAATPFLQPAFADDEAANRSVVIASAYGNCYAKSVPSGAYGSEGSTRVFSVEAEADRVVATYDWFAQTMRIECNVAGHDGTTGTSLVQFGPWARGNLANGDTLAFAFYWNGKLLRSYSALDVAGRPDNVNTSVSHYTVIKDIIGYRWRSGNTYDFIVRTNDGRVLAFDPGTGERVVADHTYGN